MIGAQACMQPCKDDACCKGITLKGVCIASSLKPVRMHACRHAGGFDLLGC